MNRAHFKEIEALLLKYEGLIKRLQHEFDTLGDITLSNPSVLEKKIAFDMVITDIKQQINDLYTAIFEISSIPQEEQTYYVMLQDFKNTFKSSLKTIGNLEQIVQEFYKILNKDQVAYFH